MLEYGRYAEIRDSKGLKDADVCRLTGIANGTLSDWKAGRSTPKMDKLQKIADALDVPISVLTGAVNSGIDYVLAVNNELRLIVEDVQKLKKEQQKYILDLIRLLLSKH